MEGAERNSRATLGGILADLGRHAAGQILVGLNEYIGEDYMTSMMDYSQALLTIKRLLVELQGEQGLEVTTLLREVPALIRMQDRHRQHRIELRELHKHKPRGPALKESLKKEFKIYMLHSIAAYGSHGLRRNNIVDKEKYKSLKTHEAGVEYITGVKAKNVIKFNSAEALYKPGFFVAKDERKKAIVVSIRGSNNVQDALVDIVCEQQDFSFEADEENISGKVHVGFLISANNVDKEVNGFVAELVQQNPKYKLIFTGHSLGGGVATILALMYVSRFPKQNIHCYAFAAPCSLCPAHARSNFVRKHVTSIVCGDDVVCRLSLSSLKDIRSVLFALSEASESSDDEKFDLYHQHEREHVDRKLFCGGETWLLDSEEYNSVPTLVDPVEDLSHIQVTTTMISAHLPKTYYKVVSEL